MDNQDIDRFFEESDLADSVEKQMRPPNAIWTFKAGSFPMFIQTQESANRMRIVAFVAEADALGEEELIELLEANYHSALDARYAVTDGYVVSAFLHPFRELTFTQFLLGLYQTIHCAETFGTSYSGGTMVFGASGGEGAALPMESSINAVMDLVVDRIKGE